MRSELQILYPLVWLAVIGAGGCISGSNPAYNNVELKHHIQTTNSKFIISQNECLSAIAQAARDCGIPTSRVFVLAPSDAQLSDGYLSYEVLLDHGESDWESFDSDNGTTAASTVAVLGSTSGTTGLPKSAALSHRYVVAQSAMIQEKMGRRSHEVWSKDSTGYSYTDIRTGVTTRLPTCFPRIRRTASSGFAVAQRYDYLFHAQVQLGRIRRCSPQIFHYRFCCGTTDRLRAAQARSRGSSPSRISALHYLCRSSNERSGSSQVEWPTLARSCGSSVLGHNGDRMDYSLRCARER